MDKTVNIRVREDGSRVVTRNFEGMAKAGDKNVDMLKRLKVAIGAVVGGVVINQIRQLLDTYTAMQNKLRLATSGQANLNAVFNELVEVSRRTRSSLETNANLYSRIALSTKDLGTSQKEVIQFTESLNKAVKLSGATAIEAENAIIQLTQGLASGTLRGDELRSVLEQLPAVADVIAKSLGITRGQLRLLGQEGKITADVVLKAFREAREELDENFKKTLPTIAEGFTDLRNQVLVSLGALDSATNSSGILAGALVSVSELLKTLTPELVAFARACTATLDPMDQMSDAGKTIATIFVTVYGVLKSVGSLLLGAVFIAFKTVGKVIGGVVAAIQAVLSGDFDRAFEIVKDAGSDIATSFRDESIDAVESATNATTDMFEKINQIWDKGARGIQDRRKEVVGEVSELAGPRRAIVNPNDEKEVNKLTKSLTSLLNQISPLEGAQLEMIQATNLLTAAREKGIITFRQEADYLAALEENYKDILDPIGKLNREMAEQATLLGMNSRQREIETQVLEISKTLLQDRIVLSEAETNALRDKLKALRAMNDAIAAQDQLLANSVEVRREFLRQAEGIAALVSDPASGFGTGDAGQAVTNMISAMGLDPTNLQAQQDAIVGQAQTMYDQITVLRDEHLISEREAANLELQIWQQTQEKRLAGAQNFLGQIAQLQNSKSKSMARIGKAAAIAQAVIDTYKGATAAYASMAGIPYIGPALGIAAAAAAVAAGMANVQAIRAQPVGGYMKGGYTGNGAVDAVAGDVHRREYVMDAATTSRIGVRNLDALRSGRAAVATRGQRSSGGGGGGWGGVNVEIKNYGTSKVFETEQLSENEIRIIARDEADAIVSRKTPALVASEVANPSSRTSKSLSRNTSTQRKR